MRKFIPWLTVILCSLFLVILYNYCIHSENITQNIGNVFIGFIISLSGLIIGLVNGLKKIKKDTAVHIDYPHTLDLNLTGKILYKDYRNLNFGLTYKNPIWIVFFCLIISLLLIYLRSDSESFLSIFIFFCLLSFIYPISLLRRIKKIYRTHKIFQVRNYKLTNDYIQITGETFDFTQKWSGFYKIKETKSFFMFYTGEGAAVATLLSKKMFTDNELTDFKQFICSLNLKR